MAIINCHLFPAGLVMSTAMNIILPVPGRSPGNNPQCGPESFEEFYGGLGKLPVLWLLHGGGEYYGDWLNKSQVELLAQKYGFAVVMPDAQLSAYVDMAHGPKWFTYLTEYLPQYIYSHFPVSERREDNYVCGMSMGGYGALKLALSCPERYAAAAGMATGAGLPQKYAGNLMDRHMKETFEAVLGTDKSRILNGENDVYALAERVVCSKGRRPDILLCCGVDDFTYEENRAYSMHLEKLEYAHGWTEWEGAHTWESWNHFLPIVFEWICSGREKK